MSNRRQELTDEGSWALIAEQVFWDLDVKHNSNNVSWNPEALSFSKGLDAAYTYDESTGELMSGARGKDTPPLYWATLGLSWLNAMEDI